MASDVSLSWGNNEAAILVNFFFFLMFYAEWETPLLVKNTPKISYDFSSKVAAAPTYGPYN